jgi:hypothetical protein
LYEINSLPWELTAVERQPWGKLFVAAMMGLLFGAVASFFLSRELHTDRILLIQSEEEMNPSHSMGSMGSLSPSEASQSGYDFEQMEGANGMHSSHHTQHTNMLSRIGGSRIPFSIDNGGDMTPSRQSIRSGRSSNAGSNKSLSSNNRRFSDGGRGATSATSSTPLLDRISSWFNRQTYNSIPDTPSTPPRTSSTPEDDRPLPPRGE